MYPSARASSIASTLGMMLAGVLLLHADTNSSPVAITADGGRYDAILAEGMRDGRDRTTGKDGLRYEDEYRQARFHGQGTYLYANGGQYNGRFAQRAYDLAASTSGPNGRSGDGGNGRHAASGDKEQQQQTRINVEAALYNQRTLLDQALAGLASHDPKRIDMYLLAVGGDGAQEVFRREVQFVRERFDREFGTGNRSIALINSRNSVASVPMATLTSIRESLKGMAARMDKEQDILFLFLTSHGSKDHELSLAQNGMELRGLHAAELGRMLKETGIRWKVVLVSACYSGGFIDAVKDEHTLVITAARHDRSSFGCTDDNDFTYFGRAFFKDSLTRDNSFQDAFERAKALVEKWEAEDIKAGPEGGTDVAHSLPQIYAPAAISAHLRRWHAQLARTKDAAAADPSVPAQKR